MHNMKNFHITILILMIFTNWLFAWRLQQALSTDFSYENALWTLGSFILWGIILSLVLVLIQDLTLQTIAFALGAAGFLIAGTNNIIGLSILLLILSFLYTKKLIHKSLNNLVKIKIYDVLYYKLWYLMIAIFVLISITYYTSPQLENYQLDLTIPPEAFESIFKFAMPMIEGISDIGLDLSDLSTTLQGEVQTVINNSIGNLMESYKNYIPGILVLSLFFGLQILNWPLRMLLALLVAIIIRPLSHFGLIKKETIQVEKEILI